MKFFINNFILIVIFFFCNSCGKDFLSIKDSSNYRIPSKIEDYQGILDDRTIMNTQAVGELAYIGSDENYVTETVWNLLPNLTQKNGYIWADEIYAGEFGKDWESGYHSILKANMALEVQNIIPSYSQLDAWKNVKGSALFFRAYNHFLLAQLFSKPYNKLTSSTDLGIPLRLDSDITKLSKRSTIEETYQQVLKDLYESLPLLPSEPLVVNRPSKVAVYTLLSQIYLIMGEYDKSLKNVDLALEIRSELLDFNNLNLNDTFLVPSDWRTNQEIIFESSIPNIALISPANRQNIDTNLLNLYEPNDLRLNGYFRNQGGRIIFKGGYLRGSGFMGLATDECYLIKAECHARLGDEQNALNSLNFLLRHRINSNNFLPLKNLQGDDLLKRILLERRKELVMRGTRWNDLRRLNTDIRFQETLIRTVGNNKYELSPNDPRYVWPIPENEIEISKIQQNIRK